MSDVARFAEWDPGVRAGKQVEGSGPGVGAAYDLLLAGGQTFRYRVESFEPNARYYMVARTSRFVSLDTVTVEKHGEHTLVTYDAELRTRGLVGKLPLVDWGLQRIFNRIGARASAGLARFLDGAVAA